jgi:hypothetical protein
MSAVRPDVDRHVMIWPVAALAIGLLAFVIAYGSLVQGRLAARTLDVPGVPSSDESANAAS